MKLSELHTGERAVIVKVAGHGGFRKRIVEMGFVKGREVKVILNAPLRDPIEYELLGYKISLRREEAGLVEVISEKEAKAQVRITSQGQNSLLPVSSVGERMDKTGRLSNNEETGTSLEQRMERLADEKGRIINVALIGNPNCGKTSLFNMASGSHEHVGNYSGVTVNAKEGMFRWGGYKFRITDLPGTYSLSTYSPEELYVRCHLLENIPDIVINVIDTSNLERNLYLTTQLIDMNLRMVVALNMYDEVEKNGDVLDYRTLGALLGVPMVPTVSRSGRGLDDLFNMAIAVYESNDPSLARHIHVNHGAELEASIDRIKMAFQKNEDIRYKYSTRYLSVKFLENDKEINEFVETLPNHDELIAIRYSEQYRLNQELHTDAEAALVDAKYGFIQGALLETYRPHTHKKRNETITSRIDAVVTHRWLGFPLFFVLLWLMFEGTFVLGDYPMQGIEWLVRQTGDFVAANMASGPLKDLVVNGIIGGVGSVIVFLPNILILYLFISLLEDSGYMARAAFIMDKVMHRMGLHGKSFIPMIMGFGCNVPAVMATRTIENPKSRLITMLVTPLMSCSARLPIYIILISTFFPHHGSLIMLGLYAFGILMAILMARLFSKHVMKGEDLPFVMELPPYRLPNSRSVFRHTWEKGRQYLHKMAGIILSFSVLIWFLGYYPQSKTTDPQIAKSGLVDNTNQLSYLEEIGQTISPVLEPLGFDWRMSVGILSGIGAKELVVSTLGVMYAGEKFEGNVSENENHLQSALHQSLSPAAALAYLVFILLYFPCIATIVAIRHESNSWKWAIFTAVYTTLLAYACAFIVYHIGLEFGLG